jgi:hypothetical protein
MNAEGGGYLERHNHKNVDILREFIYLYISPSIDPLQGRRPPGCGSSQDTLNSYKKYY